MRLQDLQGDAKFKQRFWLKPKTFLEYANSVGHEDWYNPMSDSIDLKSKGLTDLIGVTPREISKSFLCENNFLTSFKGISPVVGEMINGNYNKMISLQGIHTHVKEVKLIALYDCWIKSHVLGLFLIKNLVHVDLRREIGRSNKWGYIVNKHLSGKRVDGSKDAMYACQEELLHAKLDEYAQL